MKKDSKVYIVTACGGHYEDKWEHVVGVYSMYDKAMQVAKETVDAHNVDESKLPMTFEEYQRCNYGCRDYPDDGYDLTDLELQKYYNELVDRDGHTVAEFKEMEEVEQAQDSDFSFCTIEEFIVDDIVHYGASNKTRVYVSAGWDGCEKYHID